MSAVGSDVEVLNRGFRARLGLLVLLVIAALGAAWWSGTREHGSGDAEQRQRLLIVSDGDIDYYSLLEGGGFSIEVDSFADWQAAARQLLPDSEVEGMALVLALADERGFGFVVVEAPGTYHVDGEFDGLEIEPSPDDVEDFAAHEYAVLSVGDFSFPHRLSVDDLREDPLMRVPGFGALEALFEQQAISVREDEDRPTIEELRYEDAIERARWMYERPANFAAAVELARVSIETSLAQDPGAPALVDPGPNPFATGTAIPTPDGGVLLMHHGFEVYSSNARTLEVHNSEHLRMSYLSPAALDRVVVGDDNLNLVDCPSLAGGSIEMRQHPRFEASLDGSAVIIQTHAGDATVWRKLDQPGCEWAELATVPAAMLLGSTRVLASQAGPEREGQRMLMAQVTEQQEDRPTLQVWLTPTSVGDVEPQRSGRIQARDRDSEDHRASQNIAQAVELLRFRDDSMGSPAFIDDRHLALLSHSIGWAEHALHVVDSRRPGAHLRIPSVFFADGRELRGFAVLSPAQTSELESESRFERGPRFAVDADRELLVLEVGAMAWQRFVDGEFVAGETTLFTLTPEDLRTEVSGARGVGSFCVSDQIGAMAYSVSDWPQDDEIALYMLGGGPERRLTNNDLPDALPRFTADGRYLVYSTTLKTALSPDSFDVPRIVAVPTPAPGG